MLQLSALVFMPLINFNHGQIFTQVVSWVKLTSHLIGFDDQQPLLQPSPQQPPIPYNHHIILIINKMDKITSFSIKSNIIFINNISKLCWVCIGVSLNASFVLILWWFCNHVFFLKKSVFVWFAKKNKDKSGCVWAVFV